MEHVSDDKPRQPAIPSGKNAEARAFKLQRSTSRRLALQLLYAIDVNAGWDNPPENLEELFHLICEEYDGELTHEVLRKAWSRSRKMAAGLQQHRQELDQMISAAAKNWIISRIDQVDRNILRMAAYEMCFAEPRITPALAINEAVEIAKEFGQKDSWRFVNGVLDQIRKTAQSQDTFTVDGKTEEK